MRHFILDHNPNFSEATVTVDGVKFNLTNVKGNGCYFTEFQDDIPCDQVTLTRTAMKALFFLLTTQ
jgi:hypothetical protein